MSAKEYVFIDLSSIAYPIYMMNSAEPDPNRTSQKIVERVRALASEHPHAAICCDSGRSFRNDVSPAYKANRPEREAVLHHQIDLAKEQLAADGFPIWAVRGFEADDLIATGIARALADPDATAMVVSADKDLMQLVGERVRQKSPKHGDVVDAAGVLAKFGVRPDQMRDYLTLVGDTSDNVKGAKGIGPKRASDLLADFGSLDNIYTVLDANGGKPTAGIQTVAEMSLKEFQPRMELTRQLIALRADVEIPFEEITAPRAPKEAPMFAEMDLEDEGDMELPTADGGAGTVGGVPNRGEAAEGEVTDLPGNGAPQSDAQSASRLNTEPPQTGLAVRDAEVLPAPKEWERGLDPRSMKDARVLAKDMYDSHMFSAYGSPQAVLSTVMVGRELGLPAMSSLRNIHNIEGRHGLAASLMVALVIKSGLADYFEPISFSEDEATFETLRKGARNPVRLQHTFEMARKAWPKSKLDWEKSFMASGWGRNPTDMLVARGSSRLARMVYPDLLASLYTPEELAEIRESLVA